MQSHENPLGLDGFDFVEFTAPQLQSVTAPLERLGFVAVSKHPSRNIIRYKQGGIDFLVNGEPGGHAASFAEAHGPSACGMGFRVADAKAAFEHVVRLGAKPADAAQSALGGSCCIIEGIGGSLLYLTGGSDPFEGWEPVRGAAEAEKRNSTGLYLLDHLTHNVRRGQMRIWSGFYARLFGFREQKYFDIKGRATGLFSQAMIAPDQAIRIPLNESQDDRSQIEEFIRDYKGEGIQHLALATDNIYGTVETLRARGVTFQDTPETYYELVDKRVPGHGEDLARLKRNRILLDGDVKREGILLQIFTEPMIGPIFFEIIQRKGNQGFGEGNFQALFDSIELDQIRRGVVKA